MKLKFAYPIGKRIAQRWANGTFRMENEDGTVQRRVMWGFGITTFDGYSWSIKRNRWETQEQYEANGCGGSSTHYRPKRMLMNLKKFRRLLRTWGKYLPSGTEFILVSRYPGLDVFGKTP